MKNFTLLFILCLFAFNAKAQLTASSSQRVNLSLANVVAITFVENGTGTGPVVNMNFNSVNDFANGITSAGQQMLVQSNKNFNVSMKSNSQNFTYTGPESPAPTVSVASVLQFLISNNNTGGSLSYNNYTSIPSGSSTIINWGSPGNNRTFTVTYKANPGFNLPGGTYTAEIVYTVTQP